MVQISYTCTEIRLGKISDMQMDENKIKEKVLLDDMYGESSIG